MAEAPIPTFPTRLEAPVTFKEAKLAKPVVFKVDNAAADVTVKDDPIPTLPVLPSVETNKVLEMDLHHNNAARLVFLVMYAFVGNAHPAQVCPKVH